MTSGYFTGLTPVFIHPEPGADPTGVTCTSMDGTWPAFFSTAIFRTLPIVVKVTGLVWMVLRDSLFV